VLAALEVHGTEMTEQEIQLYTDIVKVGFPVVGTILGGVIGALSTYLITKLNHSNEDRKEAIKRRHELVLSAAKDVTEFEHLIGTYATAVSNHVRKLEGAIDMESARLAIVNNNQALRRARMTLKILGLIESEKHLEEYIEVTREVIAYGPNIKPERISVLAKTITKGPVKFYESLAPELSSDT
jgi:gas vesicle protein